MPVPATTEPEAGSDSHELPFGPGLAAGVVITWFTWRWVGPQVQYVFFDLITLGLSVVILCVGILASGLLLRKPEEAPTDTTKPT